MTTEVALQQAFLDDGLERVAWWNGRVLTAEDLADHQRATDAADRRLGRAIGAGVVRGLTVDIGADRRSVEVEAGLAVDRAGEVLSLARTVDIRLVPPPVGTGSDPAGFVTCPDVPSSVRATGHGAYLLTVASAAGSRGVAAGADVRGIATRDCGPRYAVAGVQFRLVALDLRGLAEDAGHDPDDRDVLGSAGTAGDAHPRLRNVLAALLLDALPRRRALVDPFGAGATTPPLLDRLHDEGVLTDCDVPLAVLTWQGGRIGFVDRWAVRRSPHVAAGRWPAAALADHGRAAGLATLLQFVDHLAELVGPGVSAGERAGLRLAEVARYLPPAVLVPRVSDGHPRGVTLSTFLEGIERRGGGQLAAGRVWPMMDASLLAPPIDLDADPALRTYRVREAVGEPGVQEANLVTAAHLSHLALAPEDDDDRLQITSVSPAGDHPVGSVITVHGHNFAVPTEFNDIRLAGFRIHGFESEETTAFSFVIPEVPDVPRVVPLVVRHGDEADQVLVHVVPAHQDPVGELVYVEELDELDGVDIEEGGSYELWWRVAAVTTMPATFTFAALIREVEGADQGAWESGVEVIAEDGSPLDEIELQPVGKGPGTRIGLRVTVPRTARRASIALESSCLTAPDVPGLNRPSNSLVLRMGEPVEPSDPRVRFEPVRGGRGTRQREDGSVEVIRGERGLIALGARFEQAGTFVVSAELEPDDTGWHLENLSPPGPRAEGDGDREPLGLLVQPQQDAGDRVLRVTIEQVGEDQERYRSFLRIPVRAVDDD